MAALNVSRCFEESDTMESDFETYREELEKQVPMTSSQSDIFHNILSRHVQGVWGPPGSGKTHLSASIIVRMMILKEKKGEKFRVAITAQTKLAIHHLLKKINELRRKAGAESSFAIGSMDFHHVDDRTGIVSARKKNSRQQTRRSMNFFDQDRLVVGTTCITAVGKMSEFQAEGSFDVLLIDEASQLRQTELAAGVSLLNPESAWRMIVVGDHFQNSPIVQNKYPQTLDNGDSPGVHVSVLDFVRFKSFERGTSIMSLRENHRMNQQLSEFTRHILCYHNYGMCSELGCSCRTQKKNTYPVPDMPVVHSDSHSITKVTVQECSKLAIRGPSAVVCVEMELGSGSLRSDEAAARGEAELVASIVEEYRRQSDGTPFIVTPHHYQRLAVCRALNVHPDDAPWVNTVEKMQGQETDLVIGCYGFTNQNTIVNELDFVYDRNRLNVTATRAKERFVLIVTKEVMDDSLTEVMLTEETSEGWLLFQDIKKYALGHNSALRCEMKVTEDIMLLNHAGAPPVQQRTRKSMKIKSESKTNSSSRQGECKEILPRESILEEQEDDVVRLASSFQKMDLVSRIAERRQSGNAKANIATKRKTTTSVRIIKGKFEKKEGTIVKETNQMYWVRLSPDEIVRVYKISCVHISLE